jgi:hypothetical protein
MRNLKPTSSCSPILRPLVFDASRMGQDVRDVKDSFAGGRSLIEFTYARYGIGRGKGDTITRTPGRLSSELGSAAERLLILLESVADDEDGEPILDHSHSAPRPLMWLRSPEKRAEP